jgi:hypothetical protein
LEPYLERVSLGVFVEGFDLPVPGFEVCLDISTNYFVVADEERALVAWEDALMGLGERESCEPCRSGRDDDLDTDDDPRRKAHVGHGGRRLRRFGRDRYVEDFLAFGHGDA